MQSAQGVAGSALLEADGAATRSAAGSVVREGPRRSRLRALLVAVDGVAVAAAWWSVAALGSTGAGSLLTRVTEMFALVVAAPILTLVFLAKRRLYRARDCSTRVVENARILRACLMAGVGAVFVAEVAELPWSIALVTLGVTLSVAGLVTGRTMYSGWLRKRRQRGEAQWPVLLVGANEEAAALHRLAIEHPAHGFEIRGVVGRRAEAEEHVPGLPWLGEVDAVLPALYQAGAGGVLIATSAVPPNELNDVVRSMLDVGIHVRLSSGLQGIAQHRLRSAPMAHEPLFYVEQQQLTQWQLVAKRILDVTISSLALLVLAPVMIATAVAIKLGDPGPVLFRQNRVGRNGQIFTLIKFRTMVVDAEERLSELLAANQRSGPLFKMAGDPRVTSLGRFLRATSIDELPQLFNVLAGKMSLVGPRPALPEEVSQFSERLKERSRVLPGITGLWQVEARDNGSFATYERLDLFYTENWSVGLDLGILLGTAYIVIDRGMQAVRGLLRPQSRASGALSIME